MNDPLAIAAIDQATAKLRDDLDERYPIHAQLIRESRSPWHDGAAFISLDLLEHRSDYDALILRLWAWDSYLHGYDK